MAKGLPKKDLLDTLSQFLAHNKGLPVFIAVGLAVVGLVLNCFPNLYAVDGLGGWLVRSNLFLYLAVIVGLLGVLLGDAL